MRVIIILPFLLLFSSVFTQDDIVSIRKDYLFMKTTEVTNAEYTQFINHYLNKKDYENYKKYFPDTTVWRNEMGYSEPYKEYYFRHPAYKNYPVVGVSYENAVAFCNWLTNSINSISPKETVLVRLPTEKEWEYGARGGKKYSIYPWGTEQMRVEEGKDKGKMQANFVRGNGDYMGIAGSLNDGADVTAPVKVFWPNGYGLYDMSGNAEELVAEKGITKGGSWKDRADNLRIDKRGFVDSTSAQVGFRYVIEIIKKEIKIDTKKHLKLSDNFFKRYFAKCKDSIYMGKYEVSNQLFNEFLYNNEYSKDSCLIDTNNWNGLFPYSEFLANNYHVHPDYYNYPVVNVSHKSAELFCKWLTDVYNNKSKRKFKKVKFRLPKQNEWEFAARSGQEFPPPSKGGWKITPKSHFDAVYPWKGKYLRNSKGDFLANFNPKWDDVENVNALNSMSINNYLKYYFTDLTDFDGYAVTAHVNSYAPNDFGLYCMSGNVAEMIKEKDIVKGGSWGGKSYFLQINVNGVYDSKSSPFIGFRVLMEVLEK